MSRAIVLLNFTVALVAIALTLLAVAALPRNASLVAGPAIALSPGVALTVDQNGCRARVSPARRRFSRRGAVPGKRRARHRRRASRPSPRRRRRSPRPDGLAPVPCTDGTRPPVRHLRQLPRDDARLRAVNFEQELWREQIVKRGWTEVDISSALVPGARPVRLVILVLAALATMLFLHEDDRRRARPARA